ncbi:Holliday junction resolvase RuvX [Myxococcota bacterium]|nr:Holliday junction resolvase RuvX [Myxococcota bacterium]
MRYMGLDVGSKTIGVAVSDPSGWLAQGITTIQRTTLSRDFSALSALIQEYNVGCIVVGMPYTMDGYVGPQAVWVQGFVERLQAHLPEMPIKTWDERLSTYAAEQPLLEAKMQRHKRKAVIDKLAASLILQGFLDAEVGTEAPH